MDKRGFEMQFNWIFVLLAGVVITAFFYTLIKNQVHAGESKSSLTAQQDLSFMLKVSQGGSDTQKAVSFNRPISFSCNPNPADRTSEYMVDGSSIGGRYDYTVLFAPRRLEGREIVVKTTSFSAPFRVMSFVYVTNKDIEFVFIGDNNPLLNKLFDMMPENSTKEMTDTATFNGNYQDKNFDHVVFVTTNDVFTTKGYSGLSMSDFGSSKELSFIVFEPEAAVINAPGDIHFYSYDGNAFTGSGDVPYFGAELALGAVMDYDSEDYLCNMRKVADRLTTLTDLHVNRLGELSSSVKCKYYYDQMIPLLGEIRDAARGWPIDTKKISEKSLELRNWNDKTLRESSCAPLY